MRQPTPPDLIPEVIENPSTADVLEVMTRAVMQTGVAWAPIAKSWPAYRDAFAGFNAERVAAYGDADIERVLAHPGVMRAGRKIVATIVNARALRSIVASHGSFHGYVATFRDYASLAKDMQRRFSFLGVMNVWYVLFRLGERVPRFESWITTIPGDHPRMREMVDRGRSTGRSPEADAADE